MKRFMYVIFSVLLVLIVQSRLAAQSGTLVIFATPTTDENALDAVINADQASATPHLVYQLASTDTPYVFNGEIVINNDVTITGVLGTNGRPPCVQPNVLQDGTIPGPLFTFSKPGSVVRLENLYLLGISILNTVNSGGAMGVSITGDNIKAYINNVVFEQWSQFGINYSGQNVGLWITNCKFRNFVNTGSLYTGEALRMRNDLGVTLTDTVVMKYNTFLAVNAYAFCTPVAGYANYTEFSHNTIVGMVKNPLFLMNVTNFKCEHNIFHSTYVAGMANGEFPYWDRVWTPGVGATIDLDTLNIANAGRMGIDTNQTNWKALAEAGRKIDVNDNIYFRPQAFNDFYTSWNATHTGTDSIYVTEWMNEITANMFADDAYWPGLNAIGNLVGTDPGYGAGITTMIAAPGTTVPPGNGIGLIPYIAAARGNGGVAGDFWGYAISAPDYSSGNWVPTWPLPEETSNDLRYTADLTATDGKKYGDPYWFTGEPSAVQHNDLLPTKFALSQNYPNPFNPATVIEFSIPEAGNVSLKIYDLMGSEVMTVINNEYTGQGNYRQVVNLNNLSSGIYFYKLEHGTSSISKKMMLLK